MKKGILGLFLAASMATYAMDAHLRLGAITNAKSYNKEDKSFESYAPTFGLEVTQTLLLADVGVGIAYNGKTSGTEIETVPAYGLVKVNLFPVGVKPYLVGKVGKVLYTRDNISNSNPDGKYYYGAGVGMDIFSLQGEILYSVTKIDGDKRGSDNLNQVSFTLGYNFF
ncbi:hypothetical protein [Candidatus Cetobacterium colombiensis]|jgi:hypothetical protein|uniref:Outer membrane protein beta-barrel domain-containing protein n=1 Tax=Candidatus Cetobacterium colombiensis TaxID=3073100 RepID=A0ABU4W653_9FUSO|nr:hypothetical protein [Candidatus Cetobacterium colombiensis]MDX8334997.1 hypothetical protein [Candidatus Cetobacterium colombiensis]